MKIHNTTQKLLYTLLFLFFINISFAQDGPAFGDDVEDVPPAPIDDYIAGALVLASVYGFYKTKKVVKN
ncbi:hypothetical protein [Flavobacterium lacustre]|uniref:hypothetical protein n=1 Tax=Flavobacterium lacustre TaxID=3016339 RepID=UPI0022B6C38F|nr:hypothetical protein [Flavobacterium lacustre]